MSGDKVITLEIAIVFYLSVVQRKVFSYNTEDFSEYALTFYYFPLDVMLPSCIKCNQHFLYCLSIKLPKSRHNKLFKRWKLKKRQNKLFTKQNLIFVPVKCT